MASPISLDSVAPENFVYEWLKDSGGDYELMVDGSLESQIFSYTVPNGKTFYLSRINFNIVDGSMIPTKFAGLTALGANGCEFYIEDADSNTVLDFTDGKLLSDNSDFAPLAGTDSIVIAASGDDALPVRFTINKAGKYMRLPEGYKIVFTVNDDLSTVTKFHVMVQGILTS